MIDTISNDELELNRVPHNDAEWSDIGRFALSFNGYEYHGSFKKCAEIAKDHRDTTLTDLRTCLFFEQRLWHHLGETPDEKAMRYIRDLVRKIREKIVNRGKSDSKGESPFT